MAAKLVIVAWLTLVPWVEANPTGCVVKPGNFDSTIPTRCTYGSFTTPLAQSSFTTLSSQRLEFVEYTTSFQSSHFSAFSSTTGFSTKHPNSVSVECKSGISSFAFGANAFQNFPNVVEVYIINCPSTTYSASVFNGLTLSKLTIKGGSIASIDAGTFTGLTISKMNITAEESGLIIIDSPITGIIPEGLFWSLSTMEYLILEGLNIQHLNTSTFTNLTNVRYLSLANNKLTNISTGIFNEMRALTEVNMDGNSWVCNCDELWFLDYSLYHNIRLTGGPLCDTPAEYNCKGGYFKKQVEFIQITAYQYLKSVYIFSFSDKRATKYWDEVCPKLGACGHNIGKTI